MKTLLTFLTAFTIAFTLPSATFSQLPVRYEYAVKFVCGKAPITTLNDKINLGTGRYSTVINIRDTVKQSPVLLQVNYDIGRPTDLVLNKICNPFRKEIMPCTTLVMDCDDIWRDIRGLITSGTAPFFDGFVVIESNVELDVEAVYTAEGSAGVSNIHTERVMPRKQ